MALQKAISILNGQVDVDAAYIKITAASVVTLGTAKVCNVTVYAYKDKNAADSAANQLADYSYQFVPAFGVTVKDIKAQAYEYIKTQPDFLGSTDVLESDQQL